MTRNDEDGIYILGHGYVDSYDLPPQTARILVDLDAMAEFNEFAGVKISVPKVASVSRSSVRLPKSFWAQQIYLDYPQTEKPRSKNLSSQAIQSGEHLVDWLARDSAFWDGDNANDGQTPWNDFAEQAVSTQLCNLRSPLKPFLIGVMHRLRDGKREREPLSLASGFLVLSSIGTSARKLLAGIDLSKTCDAGCQFGGDVVPRAASFAREQIYAT